jgi:diguanylate cyclase (GGDEF)-like protein/PAS domain S-box-containing protein
MDIWEKLQAVEQDFFGIEQLLQSTAKTLPDPIFIIDEFGKYLDVIGGKERSIYHSGQFLIGKHLHEILPETLADTFMQTIIEAIADNTLKTIEYKLGPNDITGSPLDGSKGDQWFEGRVYPIKDKTHEIHSVIWLAINITERKEMEGQLKELSEKDAHTNAYNRKYFMQIFEQEFSIAKRYKTKLSILLIDIDHFKEINDTYGHDAGDVVLKRFVIFCEDNFRKSDLFARYSGEEFVVMLPSTPSLGAAIIAERIRANIEEMSVTYEKQTIRFTVSIGISLILDSDTNSNALLSRADTALYSAKKKGRNRIEIN